MILSVNSNLIKELISKFGWYYLDHLPKTKKNMGKADLADHELMLNDQCDQQKYIPSEVILLIFLSLAK